MTFLRSTSIAFAISVVLASGGVSLPSARAQRASFERPPINYKTAETHDAVARLIERLKTGQTELGFHPKRGYLDSLLAELNVPVSSQVLVFSKTSLQVRRITPRKPRAVYFNDNIYIGYCQQGDLLEISAVDPRQGPIFYAIKQNPDGPPTVLRDKGQCMVCHASSRTQNVPGYLVRSVFANRAGHPNFGSGTYNIDMTSPFDRRWGGWYVTGTHGEMVHMGNQVYTDGDVPDLKQGANRTNLDELVDTTPYLSPHSDIVALMVLEHQAQMHNALTYANFETRMALHQTYEMNKVLGREPDYISDSARRRIAKAVDRAVQYLLMCDEFQLTSPVAGTSSFADEFLSQGPRDAQGRSLREFDLHTRLFKYPCSYLIYSDSFLQLPDEVRQPIVERLTRILEGAETSDKFAHLDPPTRAAILEILHETHPLFQ